jgi:hypothetical protein
VKRYLAVGVLMLCVVAYFATNAHGPLPDARQRDADTSQKSVAEKRDQSAAGQLTPPSPTAQSSIHTISNILALARLAAATAPPLAIEAARTPSPLVKKVIIGTALSEVIAAINAKGSARSLAETEALLAALSACMLQDVTMLARGVDVMAPNLVEPKWEPPRLHALRTLRASCQGVDHESFSTPALEVLHNQLRDHGSPLEAARDLNMMASHGQWHEAAALAEQLLRTGHPLYLGYIAQYLISRYEHAGISEELRTAGMDPAEIANAARWAACTLVGGCGPDSSELLEPCFFANRCAPQSLDEYQAKYGNPAQTAAIHFWRDAFLLAAQTGDLSAFKFGVLKGGAGGKG